VTRSRLATRLEHASRICLDSSILIYHLEEEVNGTLSSMACASE
jgi:hypothetical protein